MAGIENSGHSDPVGAERAVGGYRIFEFQSIPLGLHCGNGLPHHHVGRTLHDARRIFRPHYLKLEGIVGYQFNRF